MGTGGTGHAKQGEGERLYLRAEWEVPADGLSLDAVTRTLQAFDLGYHLAVMLTHPEYSNVDLSRPFGRQGEPTLKPEHQLEFISAGLENPFFLLAAIPVAVLAAKGVVAGGAVAVALEKIVGIPWRRQKLRAERDTAVSQAETAAWLQRKAKAEAEYAELNLLKKRRAFAAQDEIREMGKKSLTPVGLFLVIEQAA